MQEIATNNRQKRAYELDFIIAQGIKKSIQSILEIGVSLKEIRNDKYYKELGYDDFDSYCIEKWYMTSRNIEYYMFIAEKLPVDFTKRVSHLDIPLSFRRLISLCVSFGPEPDKLQALTTQDIEEFRDMSDSEFESKIAELKGYDRKTMGGRGPRDLERPPVSRDKYRSQYKKIRNLEEELKTAHAEKKELMVELESKEDQLQKSKQIINSDDKTKLLQKQVDTMAEKIAHLEKEKVADETKKNDRENAIRQIMNLRETILMALNKFRDEFIIPDIEVASIFDLMFDDMSVDVERIRNFVAADFLDRIDKPSPEGASSALRILTMQDGIRANIYKVLEEMNAIQVVK